MKSWFEQLSGQQLKGLAQAAKLPISGSIIKLKERLRACDETAKFEVLPKPGLWGQTCRDGVAAGQGDCLFGSYNLSYREAQILREMTVSDIQTLCEQDGMSKQGNRYQLVIRLLCKRFGTAGTSTGDDMNKGGNTSVGGSYSSKKVLTGEALSKREAFRLQKLNKAIDTKFKWKPSFANKLYVQGGRVSIDCEQEVVEQMFPDIKVGKNGTMAFKFNTEDDIDDAGLHGKEFRYGASFKLLAPASVTWKDGTLSFTFKYQISK